MPHTMKELRELVEKTMYGSAADQARVFYHFDTDDALAEFVLSNLLMEAKSYVDLGKGRSLMFHKAHIGDGQDHVHFCVKGAKMYALNKDGTAHDRSHGVQMQRWAMDGVKANYPGFKVPKSGLIEALAAGDFGAMLMESEGSRPVLIRPEVLTLAEQKAG